MLNQSSILTQQTDPTSSVGLLVVNADDWGYDLETTEKTLDCIRCGTVSSVSAMVFMKDSERAAAVAREQGIDAGLHLNFTEPFAAACPGRLAEHQSRVAKYLRGPRLAQVIFHPALVPAFEYVVKAQIDEFVRLYGAPPGRLDGHHHMHLCQNVLLAGLLPQGTIVRRNFSFSKGEKSFGNRFYRRIVDRMLARRHCLVDFFFALAPLEPPDRLKQIFSLANRFVVEIETHPLNRDEHLFLTSGQIYRWAGEIPIEVGFAPIRRHPSLHLASELGPPVGPT